MPSNLFWLFLPLAAVIPGVLAWRWGRGVARYTGDPLFAERLWAYRKRVKWVTVQVWTLGVIAILLGQPGVAIAAAAAGVLVIGLVVATFQTRRLIFEETWSFWTFATFRARLILAFGGFWLLVLVSPWIVIASGGAAIGVSLVLIGVLLLWSRHFPRVATALVGGRPIVDPDLDADLAQLLARTALPRPLLVRAGPEGGVLVNAVALPSLGGNRVLFLSTLLDRLPRVELAAILAHELAHLEQFSPLLRRHRAITWALILMGAAVVPLVATRVDSKSMLALPWSGLLLLGLAYLGRGTKDRERQGDARAAELTGDPEPLIAALTRLHAISHMPRRWDAATEARSTHPALARRIQALRTGSDDRPSPRAREPIVVTGRSAHEFLVFEPDRLRYLQDVAPGDATDVSTLVQQAGRAEAFPYERITSVHIVPVAGGAEIVVEGASKTLARVGIAPERISDVQALLDGIDLPLGAPTSRARYVGILRLCAALLALLAYAAAGPALVVQAILAALGSSPRAAAALAMGGGAVALLIATSGFVAPSVIALIAVLSLLTWWCAIRWRRTASGDGPRARYELAVLVAWTILTIASLALTGTDPVQISQRAGSFPSAVVAAVSLAAWLLFESRRRHPSMQAGALAALLAAIGVALLGTTWFVDTFSHDPLLATRTAGASQPFRRSQVELTEVFGPITVDHPGELRLSRDGSAFASIAWCEDGERWCRRRRVSVGDRSGVHRSFDATDVRFVANDQLIVLTSGDDAATVRTENVSDGVSGWAATLEVPSGSVGTLIADGESKEWLVVGEQFDKRLAFAGRIGESAVTRRGWADSVALPGQEEQWVDWILDGSLVPLGVVTRYDYDTATFMLQLRQLLLKPGEGIRQESTLVQQSGETLRPLATSMLDVDCFHSRPRQMGIACFATDGRRTHVWHVDPQRARLEPIGWVDARLFAHPPAFGDRWVMSSAGCAWRVLDVTRREMAILPLPRRGCPSHVALGDASVAVLTSGSGAPELRVYELRLASGR